MNPYLFVKWKRVSLHFYSYVDVLQSILSAPRRTLWVIWFVLSDLVSVFHDSAFSLHSGFASPGSPYILLLFFSFQFRHHSPSSVSLQTASHCVSSEGSLLLSIYRWGVGPVGDGIRSERGESRPPSATRFKETGSEPRILLTFFPVWYCASLNASVLDPREKQSRLYGRTASQLFRTFCRLRKKKKNWCWTEHLEYINIYTFLYMLLITW